MGRLKKKKIYIHDKNVNYKVSMANENASFMQEDTNAKRWKSMLYNSATWQLMTILCIAGMYHCCNLIFLYSPASIKYRVVKMTLRIVTPTALFLRTNYKLKTVTGFRRVFFFLIRFARDRARHLAKEGIPHTSQAAKRAAYLKQLKRDAQKSQAVFS